MIFGPSDRSHHSNHLEDINSSLSGHGHSKKKEQHADESGEGATSRPQVVREHVDQTGHETLDNAELAVDADRLRMKVVFFMNYDYKKSTQFT